MHFWETGLRFAADSRPQGNCGCLLIWTGGAQWGHLFLFNSCWFPSCLLSPYPLADPWPRQACSQSSFILCLAALSPQPVAAGKAPSLLVRMCDSQLGFDVHLTEDPFHLLTDNPYPLTIMLQLVLCVVVLLSWGFFLCCLSLYPGSRTEGPCE